MSKEPSSYLAKLIQWDMTTTPEWGQLSSLANHFNRNSAYAGNVAGIQVDFSHVPWNQEIRDVLLRLASKSPLQSAIAAMFSAEKINYTEDRPALHVALRDSIDSKLELDGINVSALVIREKQKMYLLAEKLRSGSWQGASDKAIKDVVNLGVGGSDLGPRLVYDAFQENATDAVNVHFAASLDGTELRRILKRCDPETTLFVVASKSFSTIDTLTNLEIAKNWATTISKDDFFAYHVIGISAVPKAMGDMGIPIEHQLQVWDWVGGRYSLWSSVGLSIVVAFGEDAFEQLLVGAKAVDENLLNEGIEDNPAYTLALSDLWCGQFLKIGQQLVLPYDFRLRMLPSYLQQLALESNGKSVRASGEPCRHSTNALWGGYGPVAQHAFFQWMHQGTSNFCAEFITTQSSALERDSALAQMNVLAKGNAALGDVENIPPEKYYEGGKAFIHISIDDFNMNSLGALIALYEHRVFIYSVILGINAFDQYGVELGKQVLQKIQKEQRL